MEQITREASGYRGGSAKVARSSEPEIKAAEKKSERYTTVTRHRRKRRTTSTSRTRALVVRKLTLAADGKTYAWKNMEASTSDPKSSYQRNSSTFPQSLDGNWGYNIAETNANVDGRASKTMHRKTNIGAVMSWKNIYHGTLHP
jgi:hypothetical protein